MIFTAMTGANDDDDSDANPSMGSMMRTGRSRTWNDNDNDGRNVEDEIDENVDEDTWEGGGWGAVGVGILSLADKSPRPVVSRTWHLFSSRGS